MTSELSDFSARLVSSVVGPFRLRPLYKLMPKRSSPSKSQRRTESSTPVASDTLKGEIEDLLQNTVASGTIDYLVRRPLHLAC